MSDLPLKNSKMTYENYKTGMLRVFVVLSVPLVLVTYFEYDLSFTNKFFYSVETLFQTLDFFGCVFNEILEISSSDSRVIKVLSKSINKFSAPLSVTFENVSINGAPCNFAGDNCKYSLIFKYIQYG